MVTILYLYIYNMPSKRKADEEPTTIDRGQGSGEFFDLSIPSYNNPFGKKYIDDTMKYGITLPLEKYIDELIAIGATTNDDKSLKRIARLNFLQMCDKCPELKQMFNSYTNLLNGGQKLQKNQQGIYQYPQPLILTVAGGNIITIFAELIMNMIDTFINPTPDWNIMGENYQELKLPQLTPEQQQLTPDQLQQLTPEQQHRYTLLLTPEQQQQLTPEQPQVIQQQPQFLTKTNQILLNLFPNSADVWYNICSYIIKDNNFNTLKIIAYSNYSDFDYKLSPNIQNPPPTSLHPPAPNDQQGFLLVRVKTIFNCETSLHSIDGKKSDCYKFFTLEDYKKLFPQMAQEKMLKEVDESDLSDKKQRCKNFIKDLLLQKKQIADATYDNVFQAVFLFYEGVHHRSNILNQTLSTLSQKSNFTEAIIEYISTVTYTLNTYIYFWLKDTIQTGAPGHSDPPGNSTRGYINFSNIPNQDIINSFSSLNTILSANNNLIPRLSADLTNYFINIPDCHTERILETLKTTVNKERQNKGLKPCDQPAFESGKSTQQLWIGQSKKNDHNTQGLQTLKNTFIAANKLLDGSIGIPDGIRITVNAVDTADFTPKPTDKIEFEKIILTSEVRVNTPTQSSRVDKPILMPWEQDEEVANKREKRLTKANAIKRETRKNNVDNLRGLRTLDKSRGGTRKKKNKNNKKNKQNKKTKKVQKLKNKKTKNKKLKNKKTKNKKLKNKKLTKKITKKIKLN